VPDGANGSARARGADFAGGPSDSRSAPEAQPPLGVTADNWYRDSRFAFLNLAAAAVGRSESYGARSPDSVVEKLTDARPRILGIWGGCWPWVTADSLGIGGLARRVTSHCTLSVERCDVLLCTGQRWLSGDNVHVQVLAPATSEEKTQKDRFIPALTL